jgi:hypothetical protein
MGVEHVSRNHSRNLYLHQVAFANSRTPFTSLAPIALIAHKLRPERKSRALKRLCLVDRATAILQKLALRMPRHTQPPQISRPENVAQFEGSLGHFEKCGKTRNVVLGQVNEPLPLAAFRTTSLALEPQFH